MNTSYRLGGIGGERNQQEMGGRGRKSWKPRELERSWNSEEEEENKAIYKEAIKENEEEEEDEHQEEEEEEEEGKLGVVVFSSKLVLLSYLCFFSVLLCVYFLSFLLKS